MFGEYLLSRKSIDGDAVAAMEETIRAEIAEAFAFALASPNPTESDLYKHVYAE
jgi:TPP-dependent pyruvate/acetoin dehydrogenase alpha subunit